MEIRDSVLIHFLSIQWLLSDNRTVQVWCYLVVVPQWPGWERRIQLPPDWGHLPVDLKVLTACPFACLTSLCWPNMAELWWQLLKSSQISSSEEGLKETAAYMQETWPPIEERSYNIRPLEKGDPQRHSLPSSDVWVFSIPPTKQFSRSSWVSYTGQLNSDATDPERASDSTGQGLDLRDCLRQTPAPPTSDTSYKYRLPAVLLAKRL